MASLLAAPIVGLDVETTLSEAERAELALVLLDSFGDGARQDELDAAWIAEARRCSRPKMSSVNSRSCSSRFECRGARAERCAWSHGLIAEAPERAPEIEPGIRRVLLRKFPYSLLYVVEQDHALVLAVKHDKRQPDYWRER